MSRAPDHPRDPVIWHGLLTLGFALLCSVRLTTPASPYFDEIHYLPAARTLLELAGPVNVEHPMLGKEIIAAGIAIFGDRPIGWRIMPLAFGALALFAAMRALWFASASRYASLAFGFLLVTGFPLLVHSRIAMLDIFMASFMMVALWQCAAALQEHERARLRLAIAGAALGLSMAAKWNAIPYAVLPGLAFLTVRLRTMGWRGLFGHRGLPIRGMRLPEAALWLGLVPLLTYALTFTPAFFYAEQPVAPSELLALQQRMVELHGRVIEPHNYQSVWYEWITNWRAIWYLYEEVDGAQRGVLLIGNPLTMLAGLPAIAWCSWAGIARGRNDALGVAVLYFAGMLFWIVAAKPVQFYYHYLLPSCFLLAGLALALDALRRRGHFWIPALTLSGSALLFAFYWPILTAAALDGPRAFEIWAWLPSWR